MSIEGLILSLVIVLGGLAWVVFPLFSRAAYLPTEAVLMQKQREHLLMHYEQVLRSLRDLDEDYSTGKVHPQIYESSREDWVQRGTEILKALDEMPQPHFNDSDEMNNQELDDAIEAEIAKYLKLKQAK